MRTGSQIYDLENVKKASMRTIFALALVILLILPAAVLAEEDHRSYKWVDANGIVHYGDYVPPEYSKTERQVLNEYAVPIEVRSAEKTPEQRAAAVREAAAQLSSQQEIDARRRRDRILLASFSDVSDIEYVRDARMASITARIAITDRYIRDAHERLQRINERVQRSQQDSKDVPWLIEELELAREALARHEADRSLFVEELSAIDADYSEDIKRFKELKGIR